MNGSVCVGIPAAVAVTVIVYVPLGVPLPLVLLPDEPPQATRKMQPATARIRSTHSRVFLFFEPAMPAVLSTMAGKNNQVAAKLP